MAFDKHHYKTIKAFTLENLKRRPWCYDGDVVDWIKTFIPLITDCIDREDYEGAKACSDAIREFLNEFLDDKDKIQETTLLKLKRV